MKPESLSVDLQGSISILTGMLLLSHNFNKKLFPDTIHLP